MPKKIKVRVTNKVSALYTADGKKHVPGDIIEIPAKSFRPDFHIKIEPRPKSVPAPPAEEETAEKEPQEITPEDVGSTSDVLGKAKRKN